jgi:hypothetical protein
VTVIEAQTVNVRIMRDGNPFFEGDVEVYPWHIGNYGGDWTAWLRHVAPEWVDRTAGGVRDGLFRAVATDTANDEELAAVGFVHSTPRTIAVTMEATSME